MSHPADDPISTVVHASSEPATPTAPPAVPGYELLGEVGRGGMGVVHRARDLALGRDVAVKVLLEKFAPGSAAARRFVEEARITGQLQHPGIPPVHAVGTLADGRPFLAMKLIRGETLADLLADAGTPRGSLVAAFEQVCQAVAYAHSQGVIHRDLKPGNVMVGAFGEVQVMDWGLAKFRDDARPEVVEVLTDGPSPAPGDAGDTRLQTRTGSVLGTPAFMPPEQAVGAIDQIDERADVFALGGVLCAILTGKPPFVGSSSASVVWQAATGDVTEAFARLDACGAEPELVALCKRCLTADKPGRPADAGAVAAAVRDFRVEAEERARRAELDRVRAEGERAKAEAEAREQRKRRRAQLALAASVGILLLGGGAFAWWQDKQATTRRGQLARNGEILTDLVGQCEGALRAGDADRAAVALGEIDRRLPEGGGDAVADRAGRCRADLAVLRDLDAIDAFRWTPVDGKFPPKEAVATRYRDALARYGPAPGESPEAAAGRVAGSLVRDRVLAGLDMWLAYEPDPGVRAVLRMADPDAYRDAVRDAVAADDDPRVAELAERPDALAQPPRFAAVLGRLGAVTDERRRAVLKGALWARPGNLALLMALGNSYPIRQREGADDRVRWFQAAASAHPRIPVAHNNLGLALTDKGDYDGAKACFQKGIELDPRDAVVHDSLGHALRLKGDHGEALTAYRKATELAPGSALAHHNLGAILWAKEKDSDAAIECFNTAIRLDPTYPLAHNGLGVVLRDREDVNGAIARFNEAIRLDPAYTLAHRNLGEALNKKGDVDEAVTAYWQAILLDPGHASTHYTLGTILCDQKKDYDGAVACFDAVIRIAPGHANAHYSRGLALKAKREWAAAAAAFQEAARLQPENADAHYNLGISLRQKGDVPGTIAAYQAAVKADPKHANAHHNLGAILCDVNKDYVGAIACFREAIKHHPTAAAYSDLGLTLRAKGDYVEAIAAYRAAIRLDSTSARAHYGLGHALERTGNLIEAIASYREAVRLNPKFGLAHNNLAWLLAVGPDGLRDGKLAIMYATRACELTDWKNPDWIDTLAATYAEAGDFGKAVEYQKKALAFPAFENADGPGARHRLYLYARKQSYRDPAFAPANSPRPLARLRGREAAIGVVAVGSRRVVK